MATLLPFWFNMVMCFIENIVVFDGKKPAVILAVCIIHRRKYLCPQELPCHINCTHS